jgi:maltose alpha-D-glucosyltransferase/alpha-amylase
MSIHMEDRFPIIDILAQTPPIPEGCQWAIFLRNHDELTLEMVTDEERDYMYTAYAHEPTMRINLGIRRRLSPLVGSDRRKLELMNGLLFSLPGTPVLYYGDEIGMGDNHYLGDRNGVRTPMQWSADRNAGFSLANPQRLILPIIIDPDYHYESINVEAQQNNPSSLLWWTKRLIALRKRYKAFGRGSFEVLSPQNSSVLAFVRGHGEEAILVVANLSRHVQYVQLDLSRWKGQTPVELSGRTRFPPIEDAPYLLTLGGHAFYWMSIEPPKHAVSVETWQPPTIEVAAWEPALGEDGRGLLEEILPNWLPTRPWFKAAGRIIAKVTVVETAPIALETRAAGNAVAVELVVVEASFANGEAARYLVPVGLAPGERAGEILLRSPQAVMAMVRVAPEGPETLGESGARRSVPDSGALLYDALLDAPSAAPLLHAFAERMHWRGRAVEITATLTSSLPPLQGADTPPPRVERSESGRPAVVFSDTMVLKVQRQLDEGTSQDLEIKRFFSEHVPHAQPAALLGALEQRPLAARGPAVTLATLERFVANEGDAWGHARAEVSRYFERVLASGEPAPPLPPGAGPADLVGSTPPPRFLLHVGAWLDSARLLGKRVAETHRHLATGTGPAFAPEPYSALDQRSLYQSMRNLTGKVLGNLQKALPSLPPEVAAEAAVVLEAREKVYDRFELQLERRLAAVRTRCHGSLSLEGVLFTGKDFVIIDFEGDRDKPLSERRRKRSPLSDVASLLRSYHYAAMTTVLGGTVVRDADRATALPWAEAWHLWTGAAVVAGWLEGAEGAPFVPADTQELVILLDGFLLERALAELGGELATRPERAIIPLLRLTRLLREHQPA